MEEKKRGNWVSLFFLICFFFHFFLSFSSSSDLFLFSFLFHLFFLKKNSLFIFQFFFFSLKFETQK